MARNTINSEYATVLTCVTPTRISLLIEPPPLIISPAVDDFRNPVPPRRKPVESRLSTSSNDTLFHLANALNK